MKVWNINCFCGYEADHQTLKDARKVAAAHIKCNPDGEGVLIDQIDTDPGPFEDYITGKSVNVK